MAPAGPLFFTVPDRGMFSLAGTAVVRLRGEHDIATGRARCLTVAHAA